MNDFTKEEMTMLFRLALQHVNQFRQNSDCIDLMEKIRSMIDNWELGLKDDWINGILGFYVCRLYLCGCGSYFERIVWWSELQMIKRLICLLWGHDLDTTTETPISRQGDFSNWPHALCKRCNKYRKLWWMTSQKENGSNEYANIGKTRSLPINVG